MRKSVLLALTAGALTIGLAPAALADHPGDQTPNVDECTYDGTPAAPGEAEGVSWVHVSDEPTSSVPECEYVSNGGVQGFTIQSLNAWQILVNGAEKESGANVLTDGGTAVTRGEVITAPGDTVTVRVFPGCQDGQCGASITAALGEGPTG